MPKRRRRVACISAGDLPVQAELLRRPELAGKPVAVLASDSDSGPSGGSTIASCSKEAKARGLYAGMKVRDVWGNCPEALILSPDPKYYGELSDQVLSAFEEIVPVIEEAGLGRAYTDLTGMDALYPDIHGLLQKIPRIAQSVLPGLRVSACAGPNKYVAGVAAQVEGAKACAVIDAEEAPDYLAPLPVQYLPVSEKMKERLGDFGLHRLGQISSLGAGAMQAQFGKEGRLAWERSQGIDDEPVVARRSFRPIAETFHFVTPLSEWGGFWAALRQLLVRVWHRPERQGIGIHQLQIIAHTEGQTWERSVTFHEPIEEREQLESVLRNRMQGIALPGVIVEMTLQITVLSGPSVRQTSLFTGNRGRLGPIKQALAALKVRHGTTHLYRIAEVEPWSRIPERRYALISFDP